MLKDHQNPVVEEYPAVTTVTPGMLVEVTSAEKVQAHSTDGGDVLVTVALADELQGKTISDNYAADAIVGCWTPQKGDQFVEIGRAHV